MFNLQLRIEDIVEAKFYCRDVLAIATNAFESWRRC